MSSQKRQHMWRFSDIYFIQLATLLGSSLTSLCPRFVISLSLPLPYSLPHLFPLLPSTAPPPLYVFFPSPLMLFILKPNDIDITDPAELRLAGGKAIGQIL